MKIMVWHLGRKGAGPKYNFEMAMALQNEGHEVHACISEQAENYQDYIKNGIKVVSFNTYNGSISALLSILRLPFIIKVFTAYIHSHNIKNIYCTMPHIWNCFISSRFAETKINYLLTIHDATQHQGEENVILNWLMNRDRRNADGIVVLTEHVKELLKNENKPIYVIPHPAFSFGDGKVTPKKINNKTIKLIFFGRIHPYKGLDILIDAYQSLCKKNDRFSLSIYGAGDMTPYNKEIITLPRVNVHNRWIQDSEIDLIMKNHDICVIPYRDASQSGVIPTALACGLPVVATPVAGLKEQIENGKTGLFADNITSKALLEAIENLANNQSLYEYISSNAILYAKNEMGWDRAAKSSIKAFEES